MRDPRGSANVNAFAVQSHAYTPTFDSVGAAALIEVPSLIVYAEKAVAPNLARRFITNISGPHEELWLTSGGQIDFYDRPCSSARQPTPS